MRESAYQFKYRTDSVWRNAERERLKKYNISAEGRKTKNANYRKRMATEKGYLADKWNSVKQGGRKKLPVKITKEEFFQLWEDHKKKYGGWFCAYTGKPMTKQRGGNPVMSVTGGEVLFGKNSSIKVKSNMSVDRIDSDKGYTKDNIVFCTWEFNDRKGEVSVRDIGHILDLIERRKNYEKK